MSAQDCINAIRAGAGGKLSDDEILEIAEQIEQQRRRLQAEGKLDDLDRQLLAFAREQGERARLAAALERRHAALNVVIRDRLEAQIAGHVGSGLSYRNALLAVLEGTPRGIAAGRVSVSAARLAFEQKFVGGMIAELERSQPAAVHLLGDSAFQDDVVREMFEQREGGRPGISGNDTARQVAEIFARNAEISRRDLNRLGASIGKVDGWAGPQAHDPHKLIRVTEDEWIRAILPRLDLDRTFARDGARLAAIGGQQADAKAARDSAIADARDADRAADLLRRRVEKIDRRLQAARQDLGLVGARLEERQGEYGANLERFGGNREAAATERARENSVAITRLRNKAERGHAAVGRVEGRLEQLRQQRERLEAMRQEAEARAETARGRAAEQEDLLRELELGREDLNASIDDPVEFLRQAYKTIVTGRDNTVTARQKGERVGPANLANNLAQHRVLHFKSADDWLAYQREFGHGHIMSAMVAHQTRAARVAAQLQILGPNPEAMLGSLVDSLTQRIRNDPRLSEAARNAEGDELKKALKPNQAISAALSEVRGLTLGPANFTAAQIGAGIRAVQSMSKLGGAVISSATDVVTSVANLHFQGQPLGRAWTAQLEELVRGRGAGEQKQIASLLGEGYDGMIGHIISPYAAGDGVPGAMSKAMERFFRWSGLTWWTDARRAGAARMLSAWVGQQVEIPHARLAPRFQHALKLHGINAAEWDVLRQAQFRANRGSRYVTPDRIAELPDEAFDPLIPADDLQAARTRFAEEPDRLEAWLGRRRDRARFELEMSLRRYFADEISFAVIEADEMTRRQILFNTASQSGTLIGETLRFVMQFKTFPLAFTNRVVRRAIGGADGRTAGERLLNNAGHIGHLVAGLAIAGYLSMTAKDMLRGWWPPRDPADPKTIYAALMQGGALGIYGDFIFGEANRMGGGVLETVAGPTLGAASQLIETWQRARGGDFRAGETLNIALQNTPFLNLWYVRPALDQLVLHSLYETVNPGYLRRQERKRLKEYGQARFIEAGGQ